MAARNNLNRKKEERGMGIVKKEIVLMMMCMMVGVMVGCKKEDSGSSNEAVTRGAVVNPVVNVSGGVTNRPNVQGVGGQEIEVNVLVASVNAELERLGAYRGAPDSSIKEGIINKVMIEGAYINKELVEELEKALKEVEGYEKGVKKEILKEFFSRAYRHAREEEKLEKIEEEMRSKNDRGEKEYGDRYRGQEGEAYYKEKINEIKENKRARDEEDRRKVRINRRKYTEQSVEFLKVK